MNNNPMFYLPDNELIVRATVGCRELNCMLLDFARKLLQIVTVRAEQREVENNKLSTSRQVRRIIETPPVGAGGVNRYLQYRYCKMVRQIKEESEIGTD